MSERTRLRAIVEVDRLDQVDELVRLAANAEMGLQVFDEGPDESEPTVHLVEVPGREDSIFAFAESDDAERFVEAINRGASECSRAFIPEPSVIEVPVNVGAEAEQLIAVERADVLDDLDWEEVAYDVREGVPLPTILTRLRGLGEGDSEAANVLREWIERDRAGSTEAERG